MFLFLNVAVLSKLRLFCCDHEMWKQSQIIIFQGGISLLDANVRFKLSSASAFIRLTSRWFQSPAFLYGIRTVSPDLKHSAHPVCVGIVKTDKCLEQELLTGVGGWWHPELPEWKCLSSVQWQRGLGRTCHLNLWSNTCFALNLR